MCFCTTVKSSPLVAHRNMVCYKVLDENMRSWIQGFKYTINTVYKTKLGTLVENFGKIYFTSLGDVVGDIICNKNVYCIYGGFHSYTRNTKTVSRAYFSRSSRNPRIYKCIIPKGSLYYKNQWGEYVSDQIIIKEKVNFK